ncbi:MAG: SusC/RagA family TonB-linked outer membrane protein [Chitinophagaceae bacterium]|nr:MAG: SusC/RagA family TonB-linked outer membrane protein [Chitinophagaceae bacterium]
MRQLFKLIFTLWTLLSFSSAALAQEKQISGTVLSDDDGAPMPGVTVTNTSTNKKTQTNSVGYYSIGAEKGQTLTFTFVGYISKSLTVQDNQMVNMRLVPSDKEMQNIVITGYGQSKNKRELSYQATTVKGEELAQTKRDNFLNSLAGRVPGLTVTSTSGLPGASTQIMLRGGTSIGGNNQPLFVVDGMPLSNGSIDQNDIPAASSTALPGTSNLSLANRNSDYTNRIADINPEDIESVTILKGPEATALYGSDGASGAIVITTKKGASGKTRVTYTNSFSFANVYRYPKVQQVYSRGTNGAYDPAAYGAYGYSFFGPKYDEGTQFYNNIQNFFQTAFSHTHNVSVEAGTNELNYRFTAGYSDYGGVVPNTSLKRYNFRFTAFAQLSKRIKLNTTWAYTSSNNDKATKGAGSFYTNLMTYPTDVDARDYINVDGTRKSIRNVSPALELNNPFWDVNKNKSNDKNYNITGNVNITATIVKDLTATAIVGINQFTTLGTMLFHPYSREAFSLGGYLSTYEQAYNSFNGTARLNYNKTIAGKFSNSFYLGTYVEDNNSVTNSQRGEKFYETDFVSINNTDPTSRTAMLGQYETRKIRFYGGYTFGYDNLVYISATGTREGVSNLTSKFYNKQPFFNYGSISGSFIFSDLDFMKPTKSWLSYGKLRVSYATTGKGPLAPYIIDNSFNSVTSTGGGFALGVTASNPTLRPEFSKNFEAGGEFKFLKSRIGIDVAYFKNSVKDLIIPNRISYATGGILRWVNGGELAAKGWEIQLTANPIKSKTVNWNVTVNFDKARTTIEKLPGDLPFYYDSDTWVFGSVRSQVGVGQSLANLSGFTFEKNDRGDLLISPTTGLPIQSITDYVPIGDRQPDFKVGLINSLIVGDFSLSFNLDFRKGGDVFNANEMMMTINGTSTRTLDREQPRVITGVLKDGFENTDHPSVNTIALTPYFRNNYYNGVFAESDFIENVNWMRLRDITLGFQLPGKLLKRQKVFTAASIYVTATDVFMVTNYSGMDPNVNVLNSSNAKGYGGAGIDYGAIPTPRAINFGVKLSF